MSKKKPGAPRWHIEKNLKGTPTRVVEEILSKLQKEGSIVQQLYQGKAGPQTMLFCLARRIEE